MPAICLHFLDLKFLCLFSLFQVSFRQHICENFTNDERWGEKADMFRHFYKEKIHYLTPAVQFPRHPCQSVENVWQKSS
jgi:hypothetical protein